jgi:hypothetical protein
VGLELRAYTWATSPASLPTPFFVMGFFWDRVFWTICLVWLWTVILLISASWLARITGVSHQCSSYILIFIKETWNLWSGWTFRSSWYWLTSTASCFLFLCKNCGKIPASQVFGVNRVRQGLHNMSRPSQGLSLELDAHCMKFDLFNKGLQRKFNSTRYLITRRSFPTFPAS